MATGAKAVGKAPDAFRTISEVAAVLETPAHVLRFWESKFPQIKPVKRAGGRRYYRPDDIALLAGIKVLLHEQGMTIRGVQKLLRERGARAVASLSALPWEGEALEEDLPDDLFAGAGDPASEENEAPEEPADPVIVGPWPGAAEATEPPRPGLIETFVTGTLARLSAPGEDAPETTEPSAAPDAPTAEVVPRPDAVSASDGLSRLRAALGEADRERLRQRADRLRPLVARLAALRGGDAGATA